MCRNCERATGEAQIRALYLSIRHPELIERPRAQCQGISGKCNAQLDGTLVDSSALVNQVGMSEE